MIVHDFSVPGKQVKVDSYNICLVLVLLIPQTEASVLFIFNLRVHVIPGITRIIF